MGKDCRCVRIARFGSCLVIDDFWDRAKLYNSINLMLIHNEQEIVRVIFNVRV